MARTRAHPPRRLAMAWASRRSLKLVVRPAPPLPPEEETSPRVCLRQSGLLGRRTPEHSPPQSSSGGGAHVDSRAPLLASLGCRWLWLASLVCRALCPSHPPLPSRGGFRGLWAARLSGKPAASHRQQSGVVAWAMAGDWIQDPPRPRGESRMRGGSCITCGHRPPGPRAAGSSGTGALYQKQSKHRHINRVEVGVVVGEVDGEGGSRKHL